MGLVLALDLATVTGWALGEPGAVPEHGSYRFARRASSHEAIFGNAMAWATQMIEHHKPSLIVWEAPLSTSFTRGRTNSDTTTVLHGLPAVIGAVAFRLGVYDVRKAETKDVRNHFLGCNPKRVKAKPMVMQMCAARGWSVADDNEADALAVWDFMCALLDPTLARQPKLMFARRA